MLISIQYNSQKHGDQRMCVWVLGRQKNLLERSKAQALHVEIPKQRKCKLFRINVDPCA